MSAETEIKKQVFYNVMPEAKITTPLVNVTPPPITPSQAAPVITMPKRKSRKVLFVIPLIILLVAAGGVGYWYFVKDKKSTQDEIIVEENPDTGEQPNPEVTTPGAWLAQYFESETCTEINICGDNADPDRDGLNNKQEYETGTDPNNADSDKDGIADGDEKLIFGSNPLLSQTYREGTYNDADFIKGGYDIATNEPYTVQKLADITNKIKNEGLHQPTLTTLGETALSIYKFSDPNAPTTPLLNVDQAPQAKLDRDTQRLSTIKKVGGALIKYKKEKQSYPPGSDYVVMADLVKSYNTLATNYNDPINAGQYVYGYLAGSTNKDFTLTYYSETQNQLIKYKSTDAEADALKENTQANDDQRLLDLDSIRSALLVYSSTQMDPNSDVTFIFPSESELQTALAKYFTAGIPVDPQTKQNYTYKVGEDLSTFVLRAVLQNPPIGSTGYTCNQEECRYY